MAKVERVAFLGLGIMGSRMAANLCRRGFEVIAWNRTRARAEELAEAHGAHVATTPAEAAQRADAVITMVVDAPEVEQVLFGEAGAASTLAEGSLCIDMSTIAATTSRAIGSRLAERGIAFLDAPVTGSSPKAEDGTLTIMVGGERADFDRARPVFETMGELIVHVGPTGQGEMVKLLNNTLAAINAAALGQALALAQRSQLDLDALVRVVAAGSGGSAMLELKARPMIEHEFEPLFKLDHMLKDVRHCLTEAEAVGSPFSLAEDAERLYAEAAADGGDSRDFAAVVEVSERAAGLADRRSA